MSYLRYLCLLAYGVVQHILCCVFALFVFVMCTQCCHFLWIVHFDYPRRYFLTFIHLIERYYLIYIFRCTNVEEPSFLSMKTDKRYFQMHTNKETQYINQLNTIYERKPQNERKIWVFNMSDCTSTCRILDCCIHPVGNLSTLIRLIRLNFIFPK